MGGAGHSNREKADFVIVRSSPHVCVCLGTDILGYRKNGDPLVRNAGSLDLGNRENGIRGRREGKES